LGGPELLPLEEVAAALMQVRDQLGLQLLPQHGVVRIFGPAGTLNPFLQTEIWFRAGMVRIECAVPLLVPEDRLAEVLELCLGLSTQGRVSFAIGRRGTPIACCSLRLFAALRPNTDADQCRSGFEQVWAQSSASNDFFRAVIDGASAETVLSQLHAEADPERLRAIPIPLGPRLGRAPRGTPWVEALDHAPAELPHVPDGYTELEHRASFALRAQVSDHGRSVGEPGAF
jgi:hypothetical protein